MNHQNPSSGTITAQTNALKELQAQLDRVRTELSILYEIGNAMRTTLKLDEILYIILTGVTAHAGLGFNRAILFLINEKEGLIEGKMGIGPDTGEQANLIWKRIESEQLDLNDLIAVFKSGTKLEENRLQRVVSTYRIPLHGDAGGVLTKAITENHVLHLNRESLTQWNNDPLLKTLETEECAILPLKAKDKVIGLIFVDNAFTKKPITPADTKILEMFANQAGLAIENSKLYEQTLIKTHIDSLTGLWNHGFFQGQLETKLKEAGEEKGLLSLLMIDIDNFKHFNDTFGHQKGDQALISVAKALKELSRKDDLYCRYGGEEFSLILPRTATAEAQAIAERIREKIANQELPQALGKITVSIGLATYPLHAENKTGLIATADAALYRAKREGKNRVCSALTF